MLNFSDCKGCESVFRFFEEISAIPHGSHNTSAIAEYLCEFARQRGLWYTKDSADNVIIKKGATEGYESRPTVIIQGHTDMVAEKLPTLDIDMEVSGLKLYRDGDFLRAEGTTLGGDDGVAVAYALALLDSDTIPHPAIEAVFTSDEEVGLLGAGALDASLLSGKLMINIDSDEEGVFTVGCAGGARCDLFLPTKQGECSGEKYKLTVSGLLGGHSGVEINKGRANAIKLAASLLFGSRICIADITGGNADNAIPRECTVYFSAAPGIEDIIAGHAELIRKEYESTDPDISITVLREDFDKPFVSEGTSTAILEMISRTDSGVIDMSREIADLPESSQNIGIVRLEDGKFHMTVSVRSAKARAKSGMIQVLDRTARKYDAEFSVRGEYPAWEYKPDSALREVACRVYSEMYGREAKVIIIHAGLECGIFAGKIEGLDCISIGPDNFDIHTTEERLSISSTVRVWEFLLNVLKQI
ncbi:MAG: aminoacyl-histidine dipeptidase [Clostridia bacterium]|nr:aminoacyl-histidine dipeptidase [Clostridia bacterium]